MRNSTSFSTYIKSDSKEFPAEMLIDSGTTVSLVSEEFVKANSLKINKTSTTTLLQNADGSLNSRITHFLPLSLFLNGQFISFSFYVAKIPMHTPFFLRHDFLVKFNPTIDWQMGQISSVHIPPLSSLSDYKKRDQVIGVDLEIWAIQQVTTESPHFPPSFKDTLTPIHILNIPEEYLNSFPFLKRKVSTNSLNTALKTINCKVYNLFTPKQKALEEFLKENLETSRIRPSKSPMASPFFFIKKKDKIINKLKGASVFTKFDVQWGYNNIWIKEGDKWKAAFCTNMGLYEPLVIFFGLTNSPTTFQSIMNDIF
ncbi:hypothetical protein AX16_009504 [Volvariella volvacea WC 439]|nr:hypothetical protein AX16_009504 [Volvariella volvacea WC 439]